MCATRRKLCSISLLRASRFPSRHALMQRASASGDKGLGKEPGGETRRIKKTAPSTSGMEREKNKPSHPFDIVYYKICRNGISNYFDVVTKKKILYAGRKTKVVFVQNHILTLRGRFDIIYRHLAKRENNQKWKQHIGKR